MTRLRCFVAMAFGHDDADRIYERIKASLPNLQFRRVDRVTHNNDIDKQIVAELDAADLVITDLTYARPSAYWEAGYAQGRGVPVIYTCRSDHFGGASQKRLVERLAHSVPPTCREMVENLATDAHRVHFDLQMRNIITWSKPSDPAFMKRLRARVNLVAAPLLKSRADADAKAERKRAFAALSQHQQLEEITSKALSHLRKQGFRLEFSKDEKDPDSEAFRYRRRGKRLDAAVRMLGDTLQMATLWVYSRVTKDDLWWLRSVGSLAESGAQMNICSKPPKQIMKVTLLLSLGRISFSSIRDSLPNASWDEKRVATIPEMPIFIPHESLWNSGKRISYSISRNWAVSKYDVTAEAKGTFVSERQAWPRKNRRIGNASRCPVLRRYQVIDEITDVDELPRLLNDAFSTAGTLGKKIDIPAQRDVRSFKQDPKAKTRRTEDGELV